MENAKQTTGSSKTPTLLELMDKVISDPKLQTGDKINLINELRKNNPVSYDRWSYRWAIWILGCAILGTVISMGIKTCIPEGLIAIGSTAAGALAGMISQKSNTT